jgi:nucleoside-diphosphate-sugar epimerase
VATSCARHGVRLVHFSTNFVFDGALERPYLETDRPEPLSVYGSSKLEGEQRVLDLLPEARQRSFGEAVIAARSLAKEVGYGTVKPDYMRQFGELV